MRLVTITNRDGIEALVSYCALDLRMNEICALDLIGAEAAVKAVHASIVQGHPVVLFGNRRGVREGFRTLRMVLRRDPPLHRWHIVPQPGDDTLVVYGWEDVLPAPAALAGALARWTIWPVLPAWGKTMLRLGLERGLVQELDRIGLDYAYQVSIAGWDQVLDEAVRTGEISLD